MLRLTNSFFCSSDTVPPYFISVSKVVLSPGPGNPSDFGLSTTIEFLIKHGIPGFGVCLGLQGMVEHFGGTLGVLGYPMHGKPSMVSLTKAGQAENRYVFNAQTLMLVRYSTIILNRLGHLN